MSSKSGKTMSAHVSGEIAEQIEKAAKRLRRSKSWVVAELLQHALDSSALAAPKKGGRK